MSARNNTTRASFILTTVTLSSGGGKSSSTSPPTNMCSLKLFVECGVTNAAAVYFLYRLSPAPIYILLFFVAGKPLTEEHIRWERVGYDMTVKTSTTYANGTSYLHIKDARRADVGNFRCIADNRVANPTSRDVLLIVKCKYRARCAHCGCINAPKLHVTICQILSRSPCTWAPTLRPPYLLVFLRL